jgi:hypothetical protein
MAAKAGPTKRAKRINHVTVIRKKIFDSCKKVTSILEISLGEVLDNSNISHPFMPRSGQDTITICNPRLSPRRSPGDLLTAGLPQKFTLFAMVAKLICSEYINNFNGGIKANCYDPKLIIEPKISHIRKISIHLRRARPFSASP